MSWLPTLGTWPFAAAGVAGAIGTIAIHLLNRRRHQVLEWGAVQFLQQAVRRNRRVVQLRDAILLALRTLAVLLFGLALARPHYSAGETLIGPQAIHAIVVIDNSMSMSYRTLDGSLLSKAKRSATRLIDKLPDHSHITIVTMCGEQSPSSIEPTSVRDVAQTAIAHVQIVESVANFRETLDRIRLAARFEINQPQRTIIFTDLQRTTWASQPTKDDFGDIRQLQIVDVAPAQQDNTSIAAIAIQDGFAEARTPSTVHVAVRRSGGTNERQAEVSLLIDEQLVGSKSITLQPDSTTQLVAFEHSFTTSAIDGVAFIPIKAVLTPDRLTLDDVREKTIPVVPRLPIVFVDQFGASEENVRLGQIGETRALRNLLQSDREDDLRTITLGQRHIKFDELNADTIAAARLIVVAGVADPESKIALLRQFVEDGGRLLIAAGREFSPQQWQDHAWLDGNGLLAAPLTGRTIGQTPDESQGELAPWSLSFDSLRNSPALQLPGVAEESLRELYAEPLFFKFVEVDTSPDFASAYRVAVELTKSFNGKPQAIAFERVANAERSRLRLDVKRTNAPPLLVERSIGAGRVLFWTSAITSNWNTLSKSNAVVMLDRLVRESIRSTIEEDNTPPSRAAEESDLTKADDFAALVSHVDIRVSRSSDDVTLADVPTLGNGLWWWLALLVLVLLLIETLTLATAHRSRRSVRETRWAT